MHELRLILTGPRVALLAFIAVSSMFALILFAEVPLVSDLQVAVALQKAHAQAPMPSECAKSTLSNLSEPLRSFDGRKAGYGANDALDILCAMQMNGEAAKRSYLNWHFPLDMIFALCYGPALAALWLYSIRGFNWIPNWVKYVSVVPVLGCGFDLAENIAVRSLVVAGPPGDAGRIHLASTLTQIKYVFVSLSVTLTLTLLFSYLVLNSIRRQA
jgi:hypothetical protein